MGKFQIIKCKTCGEIIAACKDEYADAGWYKSVAKYLGNGSSTVHTIESDGSVFSGSPLNKCCGKKSNKCLTPPSPAQQCSGVLKKKI